MICKDFRITMFKDQTESGNQDNRENQGLDNV